MRDDKAIINALKNSRVGLNDSFVWNCTKCGKCCHTEDIILSAYDIFRLTTHLGMSAQEFIEKMGVAYMGDFSKLPVVTLKLENGNCPFLIDNLCSVQKVKPFSCAAFPLGRAYDPQNGRITYFFQDVICGRRGEAHTVREWLYGDSDPVYEERIFRVWNKMLNNASEFVRPTSKDFQSVMWSVLFALFYCNYDKERDFLEQLKERSKRLKGLIDAMKQFNLKKVENIVDAMEDGEEND